MAKRYEKWMPLYIADYLTDTSRLTLEQHGAYLLLIMDYWRNGPPPNDPAVLARIVGASPERWRAIASCLQTLFQVSRKEWRHKRIDQELSKAKKISDIRSEVAANRHAKEHANEVQLHTPSPSPSHKNLPSHAPAPAPAPSLTPKSRSRALARATRLPKDWTLPTVCAEWTEETLGWPHKKIYEVAESFRDYWIAVPGMKGTKLDWNATWRNWCRNQRGNGKTEDGNAAAFEKAKRELFGNQEKDITDEAKRV